MISDFNYMCRKNSKFYFFLHMLLKFEIISTKIDQVIRLQNDIDFSETPNTSQMISNFFKPPLMWFCIF